MQDGFNSFGESAEDALNIWNQHLAHMQFAVRRNSVLPPQSFDGDTSVSMSNTVYGDPFGANTLAVTLVISRGSTMFEADVIFNNAFAFDSYRGDLQPDVEDFPRIALQSSGSSSASRSESRTSRDHEVNSGNIDSLQPDG